MFEDVIEKIIGMVLKIVPYLFGLHSHVGIFVQAILDRQQSARYKKEENLSKVNIRE